MNKLFISDLDGTLLNNDAQVSEYTIKKLNELINDGLIFTVASARSISSINKIMDKVNLNLPIIEFNGAFISEFKTNKHLLINEINSNIVNDILNTFTKYGVYPFISSFDGYKDNLYFSKLSNEGCTWYYNDRIKNNDERLKKINKLEDVLTEEIICYTLIDKLENLEPIIDEISKLYGKYLEIHCMENSYSKGWYWLTIHSNKATKDQGIVKLKEIIKYNIDEVIVFGDNLNDLKMFDVADVKICVSNGSQELKAKADLVIGSNQEDSVIEYIEKVYRG